MTSSGIASRTAICLLPLALIASAQSPTPQIFGYRDFTQQAKWDSTFLAVPDAKLAGEHLKTLTAAPHWASSPEDYATAVYVADKFKAAGLETEIVPYKVLLNKPVKILIEAFDASGSKLMSGPTPEHVDPNKNGGDPFQDDPRILPAFNGSSPSGDVTAEVVYANYGTLADFQKLAELGITVKDKIVIVRYGENFRGVKTYIAQQYGAKGVLIYSDPADDGYFRGDVYPKGPYRPDSAVQRGSIQFLPIYPGDPDHPRHRLHPRPPRLQAASPPTSSRTTSPVIPTNPLSYKDAAPILKALGGDESPREWQGALPFTYHLGASAKNTAATKVTVHMHLEQDIALRTIWDVIGTIPGTRPHAERRLGRRRQPSRRLGLRRRRSQLRHRRHARNRPRPRRTPQAGLEAPTHHRHRQLGRRRRRPHRLNRVGRATRKRFSATPSPTSTPTSASPAPTSPPPPSPRSSNSFARSPKRSPAPRAAPSTTSGRPTRQQQHQPHAANTLAGVDTDVRIGTLGSGSDYTPFIQHLGVPSTDIGSDGPYGVYHSTFDDYTWFTKFADPTFVYEQQQARVFGLEILHMADTDVLPYDYQLYGKEIVGYLEAAQKRASEQKLTLDFSAALAAAKRFAAAGTAIRATPGRPTLRPDSAQPLLTRRRRSPPQPSTACPDAPGTSTPSTPPASSQATPPSSFPASTKPSKIADATRAQSQLAPFAEALNRSAAILEAAAK